MDKYQQFEIKSSDNDAVEFYHKNPVAFYNEDDLLKDITTKDLNENEENSLTMEHYNAFNIIDKYMFGYCYNSLPPFARAQIRKEGCCSFMEILNKDCSILQKDNHGNRRIETECPKIAWGFTAFLITHSDIDKEEGWFIDNNTKDLEPLVFFEELYFYTQKNNYYIQNKRYYKSYSKYKMNDKISELDTQFIKQHIELERNLLERTKKGSYSDIIGAYLNYSERYIEFLENKYKEINREQEAVSDNIDNQNNSTIKKYPEKLLKLFRGKKNLIDSLIGLSDEEIASSINNWAKEKDKFGKPLIENPQNRLRKAYATSLKEEGLIKMSIENFRKKLN